jgi:integrase
MCTDAGVRAGLSAHGLRKAAATRFADHGATAHELMSWFGWKKITEAERYTRAADRKALAKGMVRKLETGTTIGKP